MADELGRQYHPQSLSNWFEDKVKDLGCRGSGCTIRGTRPRP